MAAPNTLASLVAAIRKREDHLRALRERRASIETQATEAQTALDALEGQRTAYLSGTRGAKPVDPAALHEARMALAGAVDDRSTLDGLIEQGERDLVAAELAAERHIKNEWSPIADRTLSELRESMAKLGLAAYRAAMAADRGGLSDLRAFLISLAAEAEADALRGQGLFDAPADGLPADLPERLPPTTLLSFSRRRELMLERLFDPA